MSFRTKLLLIVLLTIFASVTVVAYGVTHYTQAVFEEMDAERTEALVAQFNKEFVQRGEEIARRRRSPSLIAEHHQRLLRLRLLNFAPLAGDDFVEDRCHAVGSREARF